MKNQSLKCVHIVFRHGNRTPFRDRDVEPFNLPNVTWTQGYEALTDAGEEKMFHLGQHFREVYDDLINDDVGTLVVNSSKADRCIGSVTQMLRALFPHKHQTVPIKLGICDQEDAFAMGITCTRVDGHRDELKMSREFQKFLESNWNFIEYVSTAVKAEKPSFELMVAVYDNYVVYKDHGIALPAWFTEEVELKMNVLLGEAYSAIFESRQMSRLAYGFFYQGLCDRLTNVDYTQSNCVKMFLYSAHDWTLISLLKVLGAYDCKMPPYGASVIMEVHQVEDEYCVKFLYLAEPDSKCAQVLRLPNAGGSDLWPVKSLVDSLKDLIPNSEDFGCEHGPH